MPIEVLSQRPYENCLPKLRAHLRDLDDGGVPSRDVKLMVLGNGRIGKTQLCRRLRAQPYDAGIPSTHGIVVESFPLARGTDSEFAKVHIWDFGGQDIYHGTHALFLRTAAVFALVWTPEFETGAQDHGGLSFRNYPLRYWVDYVRQLGGPAAAALIIQTRCDSFKDNRPCPIDAAHLREAFDAGYHDTLQFSSLNDRGLPALTEKLGEAIDYLRESQGMTQIGASRHRVKLRLEKLRDEDAARPANERRHRWVEMDALRDMCAGERLVSEPAFLLDYLHNAGVVFYREGLFEDRIILDQGWALEAIYAVFNRDSCFKQLRQLRGRFTRALLETLVWHDYSPGEQKLFLDMMQSCGICFISREGDDRAGIEAEYIAPELLPERGEIQTDLDARWHGQSEIEETAYEYDLLHPGLIRSIVSRIGTQAGVSALYWRDGLCVFETKTGAHALIEQDMDKERWSGRILLRTRGGRAADLLSQLQKIVEYEQDRIGLKPRENPAEPPDERARYQTEKDNTPTPILSFGPAPRTKPRYYVSYTWNDPADGGNNAKVDRLCEEAEAQETPIIRDKTSLNLGDSISKFMKELAQGDRIFVFLSDKYLKRPNTMFELFSIWNHCRHDEAEFVKRVRLFSLGDAKIWEATDRQKLAVYWKKRCEELEAGGVQYLGDMDFKHFKMTQDFANHVGDILWLFADRLQPRKFKDFLKYGFADPPA